MDLHRFVVLVNEPCRSQMDIVTMRSNALRRSANDLALAAEATLDRRFPGWRVVSSRRGGCKATEAEFRGRKENFASEKDAYVWLLERFIQSYPKPFVELDWETVFVAKGPRANYFAKSLGRLFGEQRQHLAKDPNSYCRLSNGWYAKLVLSETQKLGLLMKFAAVAGFLYGVDWDWNGVGRAEPHRSAEELLRELDSL